jgi:hypothetical protein
MIIIIDFFQTNTVFLSNLHTNNSLFFSFVSCTTHNKVLCLFLCMIIVFFSFASHISFLTCLLLLLLLFILTFFSSRFFGTYIRFFFCFLWFKLSQQLIRKHAYTHTHAYTLAHNVSFFCFVLLKTLSLFCFLFSLFFTTFFFFFFSRYSICVRTKFE